MSWLSARAVIAQAKDKGMHARSAKAAGSSTTLKQRTGPCW